MARYTGPKVRLSRRLGHQHLREREGRRALERRPFPPGTHGRTRRRNNGSEYLAQLQEKQKAKYIYGVLERQFQRTYEEANRLAGPTGENLLRLLELRLDNVTFRAGWASTRPQARQFVNHGPDPGQRQARRHRQLPRPQGRRRVALAEGPQHDRDPAQHRRARPVPRRLAAGR
jgi:ribosomal protein S4